MNFGIIENRAICKFNLRGMCRFGNRCWNRHENPDKMVQKIIQNVQPTEEEGACALIPIKPKEPLREVYGPGSSSEQEAIKLVQMSQSEDKVCGICFDTILKRINRSEQTFGILPNCNHCYCFTCITKWRKSKEFDLDVSKACPECRTASEYVYPSKVWLESKEEKEGFIGVQRKKMQKLDCKYFRQGKGRCPFGNTCLYLHALPNGKKLDVGPPKARRHRSGSMYEREAQLLQQILFWINDDDDFADLDVDLTDSDFTDLDLDLDDPCLAIQYYDKDDFRYYLAMDRLLNIDTDDDDEDDDDAYEIY